MQTEFKFKSHFSQLIRKTFISNEMTMWKVAQEISCNTSTISAYYNDKKILTSEHAKSFSNLLKSFNINYSADELIKMQMQAEFILCDNRSVSEILGLNME